MSTAGEGWLNMTGTSLPNARRVVLVNGYKVPCKFGVYLWPNGWVTAYTHTDVNRGSIYPPQAVDHIEFGGEADA